MKRRRKVLRQVKGFKWGRKSKERSAKEALLHAYTYAFRGRKEKKRDFRGLWNNQINAASRQQGVSYSTLISRLKKSNIQLDRKILADIAQNNPEVFAKIVEKTAG